MCMISYSFWNDLTMSTFLIFFLGDPIFSSILMGALSNVGPSVFLRYDSLRKYMVPPKNRTFFLPGEPPFVEVEDDFDDLIILLIFYSLNESPIEQELFI
jgi:hypothetical protein